MSRKLARSLLDGRVPALGRPAGVDGRPAVGVDGLADGPDGRLTDGVEGRAAGAEGRLTDGDGRLTEGARLTLPPRDPPPPPRPPPPRASTSPAAKRHTTNITENSINDFFMTPPRGIVLAFSVQLTPSQS